ncbi:MAG: DUF3576 domain-containing protein [Alphaproteobacteria bacterium]|nr:DUF3576 domain-containing protein [Alphaproteobacteria bacterium]
MRLMAVALLASGVVLSGCGVFGEEDVEYSYPRQRSGGQYGPGEEVSPGLFSGADGEFNLLGGDDKSEGGVGIGVNSYLWRASLDTLSFMPLQSADPFGGVIITDWYQAPETPNEQFKVTVYILDKALRADAVRVALFRQEKDASGNWANAAVEKKTIVQMEDAILTRARQLRVAGVE